MQSQRVVFPENVMYATRQPMVALRQWRSQGAIGPWPPRPSAVIFPVNFMAKYLHKRPKRPNILIITYVLPKKNQENIHYYCQM